MKVKGHIPIRTCISCGKKRPKGFLIRLVADNENRIIKDISAVIQGRGAYICDAQPCLERLVHNKRLGRCFRTDREITVGLELSGVNKS